MYAYELAMNSIVNTVYLCRFAFIRPQVDSGSVITVATWVELKVSNDLLEIVDTHTSRCSGGTGSYAREGWERGALIHRKLQCPQGFLTLIIAFFPISRAPLPARRTTLLQTMIPGRLRI